MAKYNCDKCNYKTTDKSNYTKHLTTVKHIQNVPRIIIENDNANNDNPNNIKLIEHKKYICDYCKKHFYTSSNLHRHTRSCKAYNQPIPNTTEPENNSKITDLENKVDSMKNMMVKLIECIETNKPINNTYKISIKNYIQQNYPDAPALEGLEDYAQIEYTENTFVGTLVYEYNNNTLQKYLGDFIIENYKKEDPSKQSIWSSDTSRLTYVIKELLADNASVWNHDYKGVKTINYVVKPLLKYIMESIDEFWVNTLDLYKKVNIDEINRITKLYQGAYAIKKEIENGILGKNIIKYIAPYFYMDKNILTPSEICDDVEMIKYFIDND